MNKQEFIIRTLKPYFLDRNICGYSAETHECQYLTHDGKMCAVGQWLDRNSSNYRDIISSNMNVRAIDSQFNLSSILKDDAKNILYIKEWYSIQYLHDGLANGENDNLIMGRISSLEEISKTDLTELKELC